MKKRKNIISAWAALGLPAAVAFMSACSLPAQKAEAEMPLQQSVTVAPVTAAASPAPTAEPVSFFVQASAAASATPMPTPTAASTASPIPTPTPTPEPTPDPYDGAERTALAEDDRFFYIPLTDRIKERITGMSYPEDPSTCRIKYDELRYVRILYVDFEGDTREGELMVNRQVADDTLHIFYKLYTAGYRLCSVRLVDDYGEPGDDNVSMAADNTSAFNYRRVSGSRKLSWHSYGCAIDINPVENPYINGKKVSPPAGRDYTNRKNMREHMIDHGDLAYKVFRSYGWKWGGDFSGDKDYQHFYKELNYKR